MKIQIRKKQRYVIYSIAVFLLLVQSSSLLLQGSSVSGTILLLFLVTIVGIFFTQYPNNTYKNAFPLILLPIHLVAGALFSVIYFPNLSTLFRVGTFLGVASLLYMINLVNNIFLVVEDKEGTIPLFRAAVTWAQILIVMVSIPFFAGIFKTTFSPVLQNISVSLSSFLLIQYLLWTTSYDNEIKAIRIGESAIFGALGAFFVFSSGIAVSFMPTETFLRALFSASTLMCSINLVYAHFKNRTNKSLIIENGIIFTLFFLILITFKP